MKMRFVVGLVGFVLSLNAAAQETLGEMLNLESKTTISKMKEEFAKSSVDPTPVTLPKLDMPVKPVAVEPKTIAVYGVSPNYEGQMDFNGALFTVRKGSMVFGKIVTDITADGITLMTPAKAKIAKSKKPARRKVKAGDAGTATHRFYPVVAA